MPHRPKHLKLNTEGKKWHWLHTIPQDLESWEVKGKLRKQGLLGAPHLHGRKLSRLFNGYNCSWLYNFLLLVHSYTDYHICVLYINWPWMTFVKWVCQLQTYAKLSQSQLSGHLNCWMYRELTVCFMILKIHVEYSFSTRGTLFEKGTYADFGLFIPHLSLLAHRE